MPQLTIHILKALTSNFYKLEFTFLIATTGCNNVISALLGLFAYFVDNDLKKCYYIKNIYIIYR